MVLLSQKDFLDGVSVLYHTIEYEEVERTQRNWANVRVQSAKARSHCYLNAIRAVNLPPYSAIDYDMTLFNILPHLQVVRSYEVQLRVYKQTNISLPTRASLQQTFYLHADSSDIGDEGFKKVRRNSRSHDIPCQWEVEQRASEVTLLLASSDPEDQVIDLVFDLWLSGQGLFSISIEELAIHFVVPSHPLLNHLPLFLARGSPMPRELFIKIDKSPDEGSQLPCLMEGFAPLIGTLTMSSKATKGTDLGVTIYDLFARPLRIMHPSKLRKLYLSLSLHGNIDEVDDHLVPFHNSAGNSYVDPSLQLQTLTLTLNVRVGSSISQNPAKIFRHIPRMSEIARAMVALGGYLCRYSLNICGSTGDDTINSILETLLSDEISEIIERRPKEIGWSKITP
ncbi:uncharacterized protein I303_106376 [Kwoniella dejecticola CBS 10117]|uniref:Uncharacterized protein n=1 Tax=Kwoniella dejecticola CBS 10117 TaxID=1296121 RepID=A0A1A5ZUW1_9TREE|nr:uncharacterized protein I303_08367 [Kwoniella dejecticola CBS 10117]OBR81596.1 hypothetical protein I303_08367 [Kwoniella dejecticola CBS 10117]